MNLVLFGAPGAGKGTQSGFLIERKGMTQISTGDLFRAAIKNQTPLGRQAQQFMDRGELVPDEVTIGMVEEVLGGGVKSFIFDGFPRTVAQAEALNVLLGKMNLSIGKAVFLEVPKAVLMERLTGRRVCRSCGAVYHVASKPPKKADACDLCGGEVYQRKDDHADVIGTRLKAYEDFTSPLKAFYQRAGIYVELDGNRPTEDVYRDLAALIE